MTYETAPEAPVPTPEAAPLERTIGGTIQTATARVLGAFRNSIAATGAISNSESVRQAEIQRGRSLAAQGKWISAAETLGKANDMEGVRILMEAAAQAPSYTTLIEVARLAGVKPPRDLLIQTGETALRYTNFPDKFMAKCALQHAGVDPVHLSTVYHLDDVSYTSSMKSGNPIGEAQRRGQQERMNAYIVSKFGAESL